MGEGFFAFLGLGMLLGVFGGWASSSVLSEFIIIVCKG